jgi:hypothetical protein
MTARRKYFGNVFAQKLRSLAFRKLRYREALICAADEFDDALRRLDCSYPAMQRFLAAQNAARSIHHTATRPR